MEPRTFDLPKPSQVPAIPTSESRLRKASNQCRNTTPRNNQQNFNAGRFKGRKECRLKDLGKSLTSRSVVSSLELGSCSDASFPSSSCLARCVDRKLSTGSACRGKNYFIENYRFVILALELLHVDAFTLFSCNSLIAFWQSSCNGEISKKKKKKTACFM